MTDREVLLHLFFTTGGGSWYQSDGWDEKDDIADWFGVTTNDEGRVLLLDLHKNNLTGEIPKELGDLQAMQLLYISSNRLTGNIPEELGNLPMLQVLYLHDNYLIGEIPRELGNLNLLWHLQLADNRLTGEIPKELGGLARIKRPPRPDEISGELFDLTVFGEKHGLNTDLVTGQKMRHRDCMHRGGTLDLAGNRLTGEIPRELGDLREVTTLDLSCNQLTGKIPRELGELPDAMALDLSRNQLTGEIPKELGGLQALDELDLSHNKLTGELPKELSNLSNPRMFDLSDNQLSGVIPKGFFGIPDRSGMSPLPVRLEGNLFEGPHAEEVPRKSGFRKVVTGLPFGSGPPLPRIGNGSRRILLLPVALGYLDLATDILTAETYYNGGHIFWFGLVLFFVIAPAFIVVAFFLPHESWFSKLLVITHTSLALEALYSTVDQSYSSTLALLRVVEPLFESLPQTFLQLYAMLLVWDEIAYSPGNLLGRFLSVSFSVLCLAYAATDLCSAQALEVYVWKGTADDSSKACPQQSTGCGLSRMQDFLGRCYVLTSTCFVRNVVLEDNTARCTEWLTRLVSRIIPRCCGRCSTSTSASSLSCTQQITRFFSVTIPECCRNCLTFMSSFFASSRDMRGGTIELLGFGRVSKGVYFGLCFAYHIAEIGSRFVSLALVAVTIHAWTLLLLPVMFGVRCILVYCVSTKAVRFGDGSHRSHSTRGPVNPPHQVVDAPNRFMRPFSRIPYRMKLRLVATPFLDSVFEDERTFKVGLSLTLIEFIACLMASSLLPRVSDALPSSVRKTFAFVAIGSMVAKLILAWWVILPIKANVIVSAMEDKSEVANCKRASGNVQASSGGQNLEPSRNEVARTSQAAIEEGMAPITSYGEEWIRQATDKERWVAANSAGDVVQLAHLRRVWPNTTGSAAVWGVNDEWPTE